MAPQPGHWRDRLLAFGGIALALGVAGLGVAVSNAMREGPAAGGSTGRPAIVLDIATRPPGARAPNTGDAPTPTQQPRTPTPTRTATSTPVATAPPSPTATRTPTIAPTATPSPTLTPTPSPTPTATPTPAPPPGSPAPEDPDPFPLPDRPRPKPPATPTPTPSPAPSATPTPTAQPTPTPSPTPTPRPSELVKSTFDLPADATANNGATIGPYCCRGRTVTLSLPDGTVAGHAYWFQWSGQAFDAPRPNGGYDAIYPDIRVLISDAAGGEGAIVFAAAELAPGVSRSATAGRYTFTVTIRSAELMTYSGTTYVWFASLGATLTVQQR